MASFNSWELIFEHLDIGDIFNCYIVSKQFKFILDTNQYVWKTLLERNYSNYLWSSNRDEANWKELCRKIIPWITKKFTKQEVQPDQTLSYSNLNRSCHVSGSYILFEANEIKFHMGQALDDQQLPISFNLNTKEWKYIHATKIMVLSPTLSFVITQARCFIINSHTGDQVCELQDAAGSSDVAYNDESNTIAIMHKVDGSALIGFWDCKTGLKTGEIPVEVVSTHQVLKFISNDKIAVLRNAEELKHYNINTGEATLVASHPLSGINNTITHTSWLSDDPNKIVLPFFIHHTKHFHVWDMVTGECTHFSHPECLKANSMAANSQFVVGTFWDFMGSNDGVHIVATNLETLETKKTTVPAYDSACYSVVLHPTIKNLCLIHKENEIEAIDLNTMERVFLIEFSPEQACYGLAIDGYNMAYCSYTHLHWWNFVKQLETNSNTNN